MYFLFKEHDRVGSPTMSTIDVVTHCLRVAVSLRRPLPVDDQGAAHRGTHLASIHSQSDHAESERLWQVFNSHETCWVGLHDVHNEGLFEWSDGVYDGEFWGDWEPTSNFDPDHGEYSRTACTSRPSRTTAGTTSTAPATSTI